MRLQLDNARAVRVGRDLPIGAGQAATRIGGPVEDRERRGGRHVLADDVRTIAAKLSELVRPSSSNRCTTSPTSLSDHGGMPSGLSLPFFGM